MELLDRTGPCWTGGGFGGIIGLFYFVFLYFICNHERKKLYLLFCFEYLKKYSGIGNFIYTF